MYVACRDLNLGDGLVAKYGEPIPSSFQWTDIALRSHLNLGWIKEVPDVINTSELVTEASGEVIEPVALNQVERAFEEQKKLEPAAEIKDAISSDAVQCGECGKTLKNKISLGLHARKHRRP